MDTSSTPVATKTSKPVLPVVRSEGTFFTDLDAGADNLSFTEARVPKELNALKSAAMWESFDRKYTRVWGQSSRRRFNRIGKQFRAMNRLAGATPATAEQPN